MEERRNRDRRLLPSDRHADATGCRDFFDQKEWPVSPQRKASGRPYEPFPWVYDIKNGLSMGKAEWFITNIKPGRASFYAFLPGKPPELSVDVPDRAPRGNRIAVEISLPGAGGLHPIKVRGMKPDGEQAEFCSRELQVGKDPEQITLPIAWNDPTGQ